MEEEPVSFEEMNKLTFFKLNEGSKYVGKGAGRLMPMMFPLSLACNAFGVPIKAFDIKVGGWVGLGLDIYLLSTF